MSTGVEFRLLGPFEVLAGGDAVRLGGRRQRLVLATLLLHNNHPVAGRELAAAVWGDAPPATARRQVHMAVSMLRRALGRVPSWGELRTEPGGYRLCVPDERIDAARFRAAVAAGRRLVRDGDPAGAAQAFRAGLVLWRGPVLADLDGAVRDRAAWLEEMRLTALEDCLEYEVAGGASASVVEELSALVDRHPLRERLVASLMLALSRHGRQSEAIAVYRRTADVLADELGVDPSSALAERFTEILRTAPAAPPPGDAPVVVDWQPVRPRQLPMPRSGLVGRTAESAVLDTLRQPDDDGPRLVVVQGTAGVGKTALALHWAHRVAAHFPDGQLYLDLRGFDASGAPVAPEEALRQLVEALGVPPERVPAGVPARAALFRSVLADRRALLVLDNARDAEQVRPLLPGAPGCRTVVTSRAELTSLAVTDDARLLLLGLLPEDAAFALLAARLGEERVRRDEPAAREIVRRCAGLPLALTVIAARAAARASFPLRTLADDLAADTPLDVLAGGAPAADARAAISWSYRTLGVRAALLFRLIGVHGGPDLSVAAAAGLLGLPVAAARDTVRELTTAHLAVEHAPGRFALHDLLRAYAVELGRDRATDAAPALRRLIDHYLHSAYAAVRMFTPRLARVELPEPAPDTVVERPADSTAAYRWCDLEYPNLVETVRTTGAHGLHTHRWQLVCALGGFLDRRGWRDDAVRLHESELDRARASGDVRAQRHLHHALGVLQKRHRLLRSADRHLAAALELCRRSGDEGGVADVLTDTAVLRVHEGRDGDAVALAETALGYYRQHDEPANEAIALNVLGWSTAQLGDHLRGMLYRTAALNLQPPGS
ncbi:AfsR/SARP family transcriptional regulator [Catenuloplanes atrovinosus]|uniref:DNA-binding SARP family transcriptional activator n=1 Tax=Catenuloplanes atrovinosus TaxID=137266 RepID=A0AAE3YTS7_9ACTN|nr:BTAD domain-containing putative transcriptional regulator [Catenuloplanes atrovinosus]MDR7279082.1 DNA-binding SARP family transcriptional activator [Catenuloplanes atrovinosus]